MIMRKTFIVAIFHTGSLSSLTAGVEIVCPPPVEDVIAV